MTYFGRRIVFTGNFFEYALISIGLFLLTVVTLGLASPYWFYWSLKYFFTNMQLDGAPIRYVGSFGEYFLISFLLFLLSVVTLGLATPFWVYWSFQYFFTRLEMHDRALAGLE